MTILEKKAFISSNLKSFYCHARFHAGIFYPRELRRRSFLLIKKESCSQDSPPAAGRSSDTIPIRRSAILIDSRRIMHHALRDAKRSSNAWRLRFIASQSDTIDCTRPHQDRSNPILKTELLCSGNSQSSGSDMAGYA